MIHPGLYFGSPALCWRLALMRAYQANDNMVLIP